MIHGCNWKALCLMKEEAVPGFVSLRPGIPRLLIDERRVAGFFSCARHPAGQQKPRARARGGRKICPRHTLSCTRRRLHVGKGVERSQTGALEHFSFYCKLFRASLNQAFALSGVMHGRASVMA